MSTKHISIRPFRTQILYGKAVLYALSWKRLVNLLVWWVNKSLKLSARRPVAFSLETSTACNLSCPECPSGKQNFSRPTGNLKEDTFIQTISELGGHAIWLNFYLQGEPLLHPQFIEWVEYAKQSRLFIQTSTNANLLNQVLAKRIVESKLDRIIIALDGFQQNSYQTYRVGGKVQTVFEGIEHLVEAKRAKNSKFPIISIQTIIGPHNISDITDLQEWFSESGADELLFKSMQIYTEAELEKFNYSVGEYSRYSSNTFTSEIPKGSPCNRAFSSCVVSQDGEISICCFDKDNEHSVGNIHTKGIIKTDWVKGKGAKFKSEFLKGNRPEICLNCSEGRQVWL